MRRLLILVLAATVWLVPTALAATPEPSDQPTITGQELADGLGQWDGYDFQDAGDASPGALRTGPSDPADAADPYGADGTLLILPPLDSPAHTVLSVRLSSLASPRIWDNYQRVMDELAIDQADQQAVYGALGEVVAQAYALVDNQEQTHIAALEAGPYRVLLQSKTNGWEGLAGDEPAPIFSMPDGGVTMEILPLDEASVVIPIPEPTPTPTPGATPRRTPKPTSKPTPTPNAGPQAGAPTDFTCDGSSIAIQDPLDKGWNIRRVDWGSRGTYDRLVITLDQYSGLGGDGSQAIVHVLPVDQVQSQLKVSAPSDGDTAVALGLFNDVRLTWTLDRALPLKAFKWITMEKDNNGFPWVVLGVKGDACYSLQVPAWTADNPKSRPTIQVVVDVKH